jgi:aspartokinase/homoserine dehydrogenase 1
MYICSILGNTYIIAVVEGERVGVDGKAEEWGTQSGPIPTMAIVSARAGMTDMLVSVVDAALVDIDRAESVLNNAIEGQIDILKQLAPPSITDEIEDALRNDARDILSVVRSLRMIRSVPPSVMEVVTGYGEIWSARTLYAYLKSIGTNTAWLDARDVLVVKGGTSTGLGEKGSTSTGGVVPLWVDTARRMEGWWETVGRAEGVNCSGGAAGEDDDALADIRDKKPPIVIVTGFVATTSDGVPTTLKRSGSDYSATIFAKLVASSRVTMWKK